MQAIQAAENIIEMIVHALKASCGSGGSRGSGLRIFDPAGRRFPFRREAVLVALTFRSRWRDGHTAL
jgi:hypothetical protein